MLTPIASNQFKRDVKLAKKRNKDMGKLKDLLVLLSEQKALPSSYRDHALKGRWNGYRDAHIEPDWILIYRVTETELWLVRTGSHADLFE